MRGPDRARAQYRAFISGPRRCRRPAAPPATIAVLPLENDSNDPKQDFFASGMTDEIAAALTGVHGLDVVARSSLVPASALEPRP